MLRNERSCRHFLTNSFRNALSVKSPCLIWIFNPSSDFILLVGLAVAMTSKFCRIKSRTRLFPTNPVAPGDEYPHSYSFSEREVSVEIKISQKIKSSFQNPNERAYPNRDAGHNRCFPSYKRRLAFNTWCCQHLKRVSERCFHEFYRR